jgi:hypothetical protein
LASVHVVHKQKRLVVRVLLTVQFLFCLLANQQKYLLLAFSGASPHDAGLLFVVPSML